MPGLDPDGDGSDDLSQRGYRIVGRVQGVGFRWWTRGVAVELGIAGSVRNHPGGSVEVMARGGRAALDLFEARLKKGPPFSRVDRIEAVACTLAEEVVDFVIEQ